LSQFIPKHHHQCKQHVQLGLDFLPSSLVIIADLSKLADRVTSIKSSFIIIYIYIYPFVIICCYPNFSASALCAQAYVATEGCFADRPDLGAQCSVDNFHHNAPQESSTHGKTGMMNGGRW
jgi:hypothetical protein